MSLPLKLDKLMLVEYAAEVMVYFEKNKIMEIISRVIAEILLVRPDDAQLWIAQNIVRIADNIYSNCLQLSYNGGEGETKFFQLPGRYVYRVAIYGRPCSGRKTQAVALVKRFNLVYIDADHIIYQSLHDTDDLSLELQQAFQQNKACAKSRILGKILSRRLLQMDALQHGWVMLNYPTNLMEFQELFERFKVPPNKLIYLQCPELLAKRRFVEQPDLGRPQQNCEYMEKEMRYYSRNEAEIDEYLAHRHETINIDSTCCFELVKTNVLAQLERRPYVMGFKT